MPHLAPHAETGLALHLNIGRSDNHSAVHTASDARPAIHSCAFPVIQRMTTFCVNLDVHDCVTTVRIGIVSGITPSPTSIATMAIPNIRIEMVVKFGCDLTEEDVVVRSVNAVATTVLATECADLGLQVARSVKSQDEVFWTIGAGT